MLTACFVLHFLLPIISEHRAQSNITIISPYLFITGTACQVIFICLLLRRLPHSIKKAHPTRPPGPPRICISSPHFLVNFLPRARGRHTNPRRRYSNHRHFHRRGAIASQIGSVVAREGIVNQGIASRQLQDTDIQTDRVGASAGIKLNIFSEAQLGTKLQ